METEFIYCRHRTPIGVKIEEITGSEQRKGRLWEVMARQVWSENGKEGYREMLHFPNGAPFSDENPDARVSLSHTDGCLVVASLPSTPEVVSMAEYNPRTALGVDVERDDRVQAKKLADRFLSDDEKSIVEGDDLLRYILAWTSKEALYKAALTPELDWRKDIVIKELPSTESQGSGEVRLADGSTAEFLLYSYLLDHFVITIALGRQAASFIKQED